MSSIYYGGITLGYIRTTHFSNSGDAERDTPDMKYRLTDLRVTSVLATELIPAEPGETIQDLVKRVQEELSRPRRPFRYEIAGVTVIDLMSGLDDANGPFPYGVSVELVAERSLLISWGIQIRQADCDGRLNEVLSNRWTESASIGDDHLTTFRRSGRLVVSSRNGVTADAYRSLVTPRAGPFMVRKSATYTLHENGLELAYEFVDEEKYIVPPYPAIKARGRMSETTTTMTGAVRHGRIQIELTGPPDVHKQVLLAKCIEIAVTRALQAGIRRGPEGRFIAGGGIDDELFENRVALTVQWVMSGTETRILSNQSWAANAFGAIGIASNLNAATGAVPNGPPVVNERNRVESALAMKGGWVGQPLAGTVYNACIAPPTRGDMEWLQLVSAAFHDPCLMNVISNTDRAELVRRSENSQGTQTELVRARVLVSNVLPPEIPSPGAYDYQTTDNAVYDHYAAVCHYIHDEGVDVSPSMKSGVSGKRFRLSSESLRLEVEFSAKRVGKTPVIPDPKSPPDESQGPGWVYTGGTISPEMVEIAGDGVTLIHSVSGLLRFKAANPCKASIVAPVPPYLSRSVADEARLAAAMQSGTIVFFPRNAARAPINPFCATSPPPAMTPAEAWSATGGGFPFS